MTDVTGRTKERIAQRKLTRADSLAIVDHRSAILRSSICIRPDSHRSYLTTVSASFFVFVSLLFFFFSKMTLFPSMFVSLPFSLCMESTSYVFSFRVVFFYLVTTAGWIFYISLCEN